MGRGVERLAPRRLAERDPRDVRDAAHLTTDLAGGRRRDRRRRHAAAPGRPRGASARAHRRLVARATAAATAGDRARHRPGRRALLGPVDRRHRQRLLRRRQRDLRPAGHHRVAQHRRPDRRRSARGLPVARRLGGSGLLRAVLRARWPHRRRARGGQRPGREGADPGLRRPAERRHRAGSRRPRARRAQAHRGLRPQGARRRHDHRHGLPRQPGHRPARVPVERRHRHRGRAVLLPAELDLGARRPGGRRRHLPHRLRDGARSTGRRSPPASDPRSTSTASRSARWGSRACSPRSTSSTSRSTGR